MRKKKNFIQAQVADYEKKLHMELLERNQFDIKAAADQLGTDRPNYYRKLKDLDLLTLARHRRLAITHPMVQQPETQQ